VEYLDHIGKKEDENIKIFSIHCSLPSILYADEKDKKKHEFCFN
jgi:hypothetical protein